MTSRSVNDVRTRLGVSSGGRACRARRSPSACGPCCRLRLGELLATPSSATPASRPPRPARNQDPTRHDLMVSAATRPSGFVLQRSAGRNDTPRSVPRPAAHARATGLRASGAPSAPRGRGTGALAGRQDRVDRGVERSAVPAGVLRSRSSNSLSLRVDRGVVDRRRWLMSLRSSRSIALALHELLAPRRLQLSQLLDRTGRYCWSVSSQRLLGRSRSPSPSHDLLDFVASGGRRRHRRSARGRAAPGGDPAPAALRRAAAELWPEAPARRRPEPSSATTSATNHDATHRLLHAPHSLRQSA